MNWFAFGNALGEGRNQRYQINQQREIQKFNIKNQEQNAALKAQQTSQAEEQQRRESRQLLGSQRAAVAQSGVGFGGSSDAIMRQSSAAAELDALNIRYAGDLERMGILNDIEMMKYQDKLMQRAGKMAMRVRWINALSALYNGQTADLSKDAKAKTADGRYGQGGTPTTSHGWASSSRGAYGGMSRAGGNSGSSAPRVGPWS